MDKLRSMEVFLLAMDEGSYAAAADRLGMSAQMVGRHIRMLEAWIGARLVSKTTRKQSMTEAGLIFYERCKVLLAEVEGTKNLTQALMATPRGKLRLAAPLSFGQHQLMPLLTAFLEQYRDISVELYLSNRQIDAVEEGFDVVIRVPTESDSHLIALPLVEQQLCLCAAPSYLDRYGTPLHPDDLNAHACLHGNWSGTECWHFQKGSAQFQHYPRSRLTVNSWPALKEATLHGAGISLQPLSSVKQDLERGALRCLLSEFVIPSKTLCFLYPIERRGVPKVRALGEYLQACFL